jgi:hypothetical protein
MPRAPRGPSEIKGNSNNICLFIPPKLLPVFWNGYFYSGTESYSAGNPARAPAKPDIQSGGQMIGASTKT